LGGEGLEVRGVDAQRLLEEWGEGGYLTHPSTSAAIQKYDTAGWVEGQRNPTFRESLMLQN